MRNLVLSSFCTALAACQPQEAPSAFGTLERERVLLTAPATELILSQSALEGSKIKAGQPLLQLDPQLQQLKVDKARAEVQRAQAALELLLQGNRAEQIAAAAARLEQSKLRLADSERQRNRARQLRQQRLVAQAELDAAELAARLAQAQLADAAQQLQELQAGSRPEQVSQARFALESAQQSLNVELKLLADLTLVASRDGVLEDLPYHIGERVPQGAVLAVIAADAAPYARVYLPQTALSQFSTGQQVQVRVDGQSQPLAGTIRKIATEASFTPYFALHQAERAHLMYVTEISLSPDLTLATGLPVQLALPETADE
ncbi:MAG: HlyD family efflux transporter periplasmic adaptor subunit [Rheinheimera sp.]|nr:HlyD family efflux transporter periplasmic adaptor subunit [Rheinheimera sp.]